MAAECVKALGVQSVVAMSDRSRSPPMSDAASAAQSRALVSKPRRLVVAQWNLAGVNEEPLEFRLAVEAASPATHNAVSFLLRLSALVQQAIEGSDSKAARKLAQISSRGLLDAIVELRGSSELVAKLCGLAEEASEDTVVEQLRDVVDGKSKALGRANMALFNRRGGFIKLAPTEARELAQHCATGDATSFGRQLVSSIECAHPEAAAEKAEHVLALVTFEGFLFAAAVEVCRGGDGGEAFGDAGALGASLSAFVESMCVDTSSKGLQVVRSLECVDRPCRPDVWCLQEFNKGWLGDLNFALHWDKMLADHALFDPISVKNPAMVTQLLIRKSGTLTVDMAATSRARATSSSEAFRESLRSVYEPLFREATGSQLDAATGPVGFLTIKVSMAVCAVGEGVPLLVVAAHAASDGTDNRAIVAAVQHLAEREGCRLLLGLDANSAAKFDEKQRSNGACTQHDFVNFLSQRCFQHCFNHLDPETVSDPARFTTVRKCRSHLQCQLQKAGKPDFSAKDFVLGTGVRFHSGVRLNTFAWTGGAGAEPPDFLPEERDTWVGHADMPSPQFGSDHAMIIAEATLE